MMKGTRMKVRAERKKGWRERGAPSAAAGQLWGVAGGFEAKRVALLISGRSQ